MQGRKEEPRATNPKVQPLIILLSGLQWREDGGPNDKVLSKADLVKQPTNTTCALNRSKGDPGFGHAVSREDRGNEEQP